MPLVGHTPATGLQLDHLGRAAFGAGQIGVDLELAEGSAEGHVRVERELLIGEEQHQVLEQLGTDPGRAVGIDLVEIDTDGLDDGSIAWNPDFSFGGDTSTASQSAASGALGMTGGDSIYGGDGVASPDTYVYTYTPGSQADNLFLSAGTPLGDGNYATGGTGGGPGRYAVYATWPKTSNVSGGLTNYQTVTAGDGDLVSVDQNGPGGEGSVDTFGNVWVKVGEVDYLSGSITVTQTPTTSTAVSMRAAGILFEMVSGGGGGGYEGPPGPVIFGEGAQQFLGLAFERDKAMAGTHHHSVLRSTDLQDWATTDLKLFSVTNLDDDTELVTFRSMAPMAGQSSEFLRVRAREKMPVTVKPIAMTFDDGPHPTRTLELLDHLAARNVRATFFVTGINAGWHPHVIRRMINEGHEVGNHSMNHPNFTTITEAEVIDELAGCRDAVVAAGTVPPFIMRPPYGARTPALESLWLNEFGYPTIMWDIDPRDWDVAVTDQEVIDSIVNGVVSWFSPPLPSRGPIVLMHDIHQRSVDVTPTILDALLDTLQAEGYSFVTVSELRELSAP